jgi:hypothetical protein
LKSSGGQFFGRPNYWQGEDEEHGPKKKKAKDAKKEKPVLLLNLEIEDASLHIWGLSSQIRKGNFSAVKETFSTT